MDIFLISGYPAKISGYMSGYPDISRNSDIRNFWQFKNDLGQCHINLGEQAQRNHTIDSMFVYTKSNPSFYILGKRTSFTRPSSCYADVFARRMLCCTTVFECTRLLLFWCLPIVLLDIWLCMILWLCVRLSSVVVLVCNQPWNDRPAGGPTAEIMVGRPATFTQHLTFIRMLNEKVPIQLAIVTSISWKQL